MAKQKIYCRSCGTLHVSDGSDKTAGKVGVAVGGLGGGWLGSSVGLAGSFGAVSGLVPLVGVGALVGWLVLRNLSRPNCTKCGASL